MIVKVNQKHINTGKRNNSEKCPLAIALNDTTGIKWSVGLTSCSPGEGYIMKKMFFLPLRAIQFIKDFDNRKITKPFEFELTINEEK